VSSFDEILRARLALIRGQNRYRELLRVGSAQGTRLQIGGKTFLNFSANDYLGLANHPALREAAIKAVEKFGAGAGASRLISGSVGSFHELEESLAAFKKTGAALAFSSGYAAAVGTLTALAGKDDVIILDKLVHACIVDGARLSGAKLRVFAHNDLERLEEKLKWARQHAAGEVLVVTESIFSMDGDAAPLHEIVALKEKYGARLMVDEAHASGILGHAGRGLADKLGLNGRIEIHMGTLGKAFGSAGGYICGSRELIDFLVNRSRSFIFSTAPVPASAAAATAGIAIARSTDGDARRQRLFARMAELKSKVKSAGARLPAGLTGAIMPVVLGDEQRATEAADRLRTQNLFVPAIRYPTVGRGAARLRITLTSEHSAEDVSRLASALNTL
jgi:8-amino-7-oxononanoate synthase